MAWATTDGSGANLNSIWREEIKGRPKIVSMMGFPEDIYTNGVLYLMTAVRTPCYV